MAGRARAPQGTRAAWKSFFDVDGEALVERLSGLAKIADARWKEILFQ